MKIYIDSNLTEELEDDTFDLGIVPAGEIKEFKFFCFNDSNALLKNLEFSVEHEEVEIKEAPEELITKGMGELIILWSPSITLKEGLKAKLSIKGIELYG